MKFSCIISREIKVHFDFDWQSKIVDSGAVKLETEVGCVLCKCVLFWQGL